MLIDYHKVNIYHDDICILKDVDFHVDKGQLVYIIGKVGSGKSSLLKTIYCELDIDEYEKAVVLDKDITALKRKEIPSLRKKMGIIFQDFQLLHDRSLRENLAFVLKATGWKKEIEINNRIDEVLTIVELEEKANSMPHELSGGEQQRAAIARALLNNPEIILADEPTGNLDQETARFIFSLFKNLSQSGTAVVVTTHNIAMIKDYPGLVYRCENGLVEEDTSLFHTTSTKEEGERQ